MCDQQRLIPACVHVHCTYSLMSLATGRTALEFLSLAGGCTGSSEYILVKMQHCWKSHVAAQMSLRKVSLSNFNLPSPRTASCCRNCANHLFFYFSSPEPKALGELIGWDSSPSVRASVRHHFVSTILFP